MCAHFVLFAQWVCQSTLTPGHIGESCHFRSLRALVLGQIVTKTHQSHHPPPQSGSRIPSGHTVSRTSCQLLPSKYPTFSSGHPLFLPPCPLSTKSGTPAGDTEQIPLQTGGSGHCAARGTHCMNPHTQRTSLVQV